MWRRHYNAVRPHGSLGYRPPARKRSSRQALNRPALTPQILHQVAVTLNDGEIGAIENLARILRRNPDTIAAWCAGTEPIANDVLTLVFSAMGGTSPTDPTWPGTNGLSAAGPAGPSGIERLYLFHLWPPRFRCRAVEIDLETGEPLDTQAPADIDQGINYPVTDELVLAEFEWIDPPPRPDHLVNLLDAAVDAFQQLSANT